MQAAHIKQDDKTDALKAQLDMMVRRRLRECICVSACVCMCEHVCACARACLCMFVRAPVRACMRACATVCVACVTVCVVRLCAWHA